MSSKIKVWIGCAIIGSCIGGYYGLADKPAQSVNTASNPAEFVVVPVKSPTPTPTATIIVESDPIETVKSKVKLPSPVYTPSPAPIPTPSLVAIQAPAGWVNARKDDVTGAQIWATPEMSKSYQGEMFIFKDGGWIKLFKQGNSVVVESGLGKTQVYFKVFHASNRAGNRRETDISAYKLGDGIKTFTIDDGKFAFARPIVQQQYQLMLDNPKEIR
jgi:hypothetical protein